MSRYGLSDGIATHLTIGLVVALAVIQRAKQDPEALRLLIEILREERVKDPELAAGIDAWFFQQFESRL